MKGKPRFNKKRQKKKKQNKKKQNKKKQNKKVNTQTKRRIMNLQKILKLIKLMIHQSNKPEEEKVRERVNLQII